MELDKFYEYLSKPQMLDATSLKDCREVVEYYPYFQLGQVLYTKNLKNCNHFRFRDQLKLTALFSSDRTLLKKIMEGRYPAAVVNPNEEKEPQQGYYQLEGDEQQIPDLGVIADQLKQKRRRKISKKQKQVDLIERFVLKETPAETREKATVDIPSSSEPKELMTETLAGIYVTQGLYKEAIGAFERLSLKYPEKNAYFALKIKEIEKLLKK